MQFHNSLYPADPQTYVLFNRTNGVECTVLFKTSGNGVLIESAFGFHCGFACKTNNAVFSYQYGFEKASNSIQLDIIL